jgi:predicted choloylglycine hydrolase
MPFFRDGIPRWVIIKFWLERCSTIKECLKILKEAKRLGGVNCVLADLSGGSQVTMLEYTPKQVETFELEGEAIFRTNHPLSSKIKSRVYENEKTRPGLENSRRRFKTLERLTRKVSHTVKGMKKILSNHRGEARICQHYQVKGAVMSTGGSMIMVPQKRELYALQGHPCRKEYKKFKLSKCPEGES